jgi:hypothetical protein
VSNNKIGILYDRNHKNNHASSQGVFKFIATFRFEKKRDKFVILCSGLPGL